jgi:hypothetical protein
VRKILEEVMGPQCGITSIEVRETQVVSKRKGKGKGNAGHGNEEDDKELQSCTFAKVTFATTAQAQQAALSEFQQGSKSLWVNLMNDVHLSHKLSETLRHNGVLMGLDIRPDAYVNLGQLLEKDARIEDVSVDMFIEAVEENKKTAILSVSGVSERMQGGSQRRRW